MNISSALSQARQNLDAKGVSNSKLDSLILLTHAFFLLGISFSKEQIIFNPDHELSLQQQQVFFNLILRRSNREPISHIIGKREFYGEDFLVSKDVLDPRPDSESLIEAVFSNFSDKSQKLKILELGVGSGCLIITLLRSFRLAAGTGVDVSEKALAVCQKNAVNHQVADRLQLTKSDLFGAINQQEKFDLIISNPPYIPSQDIESLEPEVRVHEPRLALDGGKDGLDFYRQIALEAKNFLNKKGQIILEIGINQQQEIADIFMQEGFLLLEEKRDLAQVVRVLRFGLVG